MTLGTETGTEADLKRVAYAPENAPHTGQRAAQAANVAIKSATKLTTYDRWLRFHQANPGVYRALEGTALYAVRTRPGRRFGVKALWEIMRYEDRPAFQKLGKALGEDWQFPNDYTALYARLLAEMHPDLTGDRTADPPREPYFEMRALRTSEWPTDAKSRDERNPATVEAKLKEAR